MIEDLPSRAGPKALGAGSGAFPFSRIGPPWAIPRRENRAAKNPSNPTTQISESARSDFPADAIKTDPRKIFCSRSLGRRGVRLAKRASLHSDQEGEDHSARPRPGHLNLRRGCYIWNLALPPVNRDHRRRAGGRQGGGSTTPNASSYRSRVFASSWVAS
jgi:hypothetical protein